MKVTYNWLKDFVEIKISPQTLANKLTMAGLEVTSLEAKDGDFVFELEITSNRPDCLSVIGIAREVAAITGKKIKRSPVTSYQSPVKNLKPEARGLKPINIVIEDQEDCPLYTAKIIEDVKVAPSPDWLKKRLELVGCRSVNNIVDITNYVLFEFGEPLHAFDLDTLAGNTIIVRRASGIEKLVSIDAEERSLSPDILVIADREKPVAIAGVMGGKDTEVSEITKNILLEAAIFNPLIVRRGRQKLGIQSEASYRFERGIDPQIVEIASQRAAELIRKIAGGTFVLAKNAGLAKSGEREIDLDIDRVNKNLGINITATDIKRILSSLGFKVRSKIRHKNLRKRRALWRAKKSFNVGIPLYRQDVKTQIDLIEEIARIFGYENIPRTLPSVSLQTQTKQISSLIPLIKNILFGLGLNEVITYSLIDRESLKGFWDKEDNLIEISNPLSQEQGVLRPLLMPSLARCIAYNLRQQQPYVNIFEIAKTYSFDNNKIREKYSLGIALCGTKSRWFGPTEKQVQDEQGFYHLKGILDVLFERLGIPEKGDYRFMANGEVEVYIGNAKVGILKNLREEILDRLDVKYKKIFEAEIALEEKMFPFIQTDKKFDVNKVARYPAIIRDVTLQLKEETPLKEIMVAASQIGESLLVFVEFVTYYKGEKVPAGFKRITISCKYRSEDRTLTEEEVAPIHDRLVKILQEKFQAEIC